MKRVLSIMALIVAVCSGAWAQRIAISTDITHGTVAVDNANPTGAATVTLTVTPATGYYITASDIVVTRTAPAAQAPRRTLGTQYAVTAATVDATGKGTYTFNVEDGYGAYVEATFTACSAITPSVSIDGWTYGEAGNNPSVTGNTGNGAVTIDYKVKDAGDDTYTDTKPTAAGNYTVRATIAAAGHYLGGTATKDFTIAALTGVVVTITGHNNKAAFDGTEHTVSGYNVSISNNLYKETDFTFSGTAEAKRTEVGKTMMGLTASLFTNNNTNFSNVTFNVTDGYQEITSIDEVIVTITGHINTANYDGTEHSVSGYDVSFSNALYTESDFTFSGTAVAKRTDAGKTMMGLAASQFTNTNVNYSNVTFVVTDGYQEISPITATVTITGHHDAVTYDGTEHSVSGYDVKISNDLYKETDFTFSGTAEAKRTDEGKTMMGLAASQFANNNANFSNVTFDVTDGYLQITAVTDVVVTITGHNNTTDYDGTEHSVSGYDVKISNPLYKESYFTFSGTAVAKRTNAGKTMMGLSASQFANTNLDFTSVTFNVTDGYQTISPVTATVTISGHRDIVVYDGTEHKVSGYDVTLSNNLYKETDFTFSGTADAARTDQGTTDMGLAASQFTNNNTNFSSVTFNVIDGCQTINRKVPALTVTVTPKVYDGKTDAEVSVTVDTHVNGESMNITGLTGTFVNANAGTDKTVTVNSSKAVVKAGENTKLDNYEVVYPIQVKGTIAKAALTITADNKERIEGEENPTLTATYTGFVNNEDKNVLTTQPTIQTTATKESIPGDYPITVSGAEAANYAISYKNGTLTVHAKGNSFDIAGGKNGSGIRVVRNDTGEEIPNIAKLTYMNDKKSLCIDKVTITAPADASATNTVAVTINIPEVLKDNDGVTLKTYGVASNSIVTDANVPVTDINMPETDEIINVATQAFHLNTTAGTTARIHTSLGLLDDYALTPGLKAEYEDGHVMTTVHVTSEYWTLSSGVDIALPKAITPLLCKLYDSSSLATYAISEPTVKTDEGEQVLLFSNNGVLLKSMPGDYTLTAWPTVMHPSGSAISSESVTSYEGNLLECVIESRHLPYNEGYYVLKDGKFHPVKDNDAKIPAGRAVLHVSTNSPAFQAPVLSIVDGETTSLSSIPSPSREEGNQAWYTLDGRKLDGMPTKKGIYINGGRKVVVR